MSALKKLAMNSSKPLIMPITKALLKRFYTRNKSLSDVTGERVLVLAPHVDDETIGLGGTIQRHVQECHHVTCVYITDGASSVSNLPKEQLIAERKKEAEQVKGILGIHDLQYMDLPDGHVESNEKSQEQLKRILSEVSPDIIYLPIFVDCHRDHIATGRILADVLDSQEEWSLSVRLYEINCPIPPDDINCVIDISTVYAQKQKAIDVFKSQAIDFDGFDVLSKVKAQLLKNKNVRAVETFLELSVSDFVKQFKAIDKEGYKFDVIFKQVNKAVTLLWGIFQNYRQKVFIYKERLK
jgi:LmbE family N-acetylglucosaminyl deacetylase